MSVEAITWALRQPITHSSAKFVLVVLANCASAEKAQAWPSVAYLSSSTGQDRKTVLANLQRLQEWKMIEDTGKRVGDTRQIVVYRLNCDPDLFVQPGNSPENGTVPKTEQSQKRNSSENSGKQSRFSREESQKRDTEPSITQRNQRESTRAPAGTRLPPSWEPSAEDQGQAKRDRPDLDLAIELAKFRDHFAAKPGRAGESADWDATWRNWIRRADPPRAAAAPMAPAPVSPPAKPRDWRADPESKLENAVRFIEQQFACGALGEGAEAEAERDRQIAQARLKHAPQAEPA